MKNFSKILLLVSIVFPGMLIISNASAADIMNVGKVIAASGDLFAVSADESQRKLKRRSKFHQGEILRTGKNSRAQLRFLDGSIVSMRSETEYRIDKYQFNKDGKGENKFIGTLLKGGMRSITGIIGKKQPKAYRLNTPAATIGIRGTVKEVVMTGEGLYVAAWKGGITVENNEGKIELGQGGEYNFAHVKGMNDKPEGLLLPPKPFTERPQQGQTGDKPAPDDSAVPAAGSEPAETQETTESVATESDDQTSDGSLETIISEGDDQLLEGPLEPVATDGTGDQVVFDSSQTSILPALDPSLDTTTGGGGATQPPPTDPLLSTDFRLTSAELASLDRLGLALDTGAPGSQRIVGGKSSDGANGNPIIADNNLGPADANFSTAPISTVIRKGTAPIGFNSTNGTYDVSWGEWTGAVSTPVIKQTSASDPSITDPIFFPVYWATLIPTPKATIDALSGSIVYSNVLSFKGGGPGGNVTGVSFSANIDFATGAVTSGSLIVTDANTWNANFTGTLRGPEIDILPQNITGTVNGAGSINGDIVGVLTGSNAQAIGGGFTLEDASDAFSHVEGVFLVECAGGYPSC